jgi:hypothetical protein
VVVGGALLVFAAGEVSGPALPHATWRRRINIIDPGECIDTPFIYTHRSWDKFKISLQSSHFTPLAHHP